jgi:hypothetical protein
MHEQGAVGNYYYAEIVVSNKRIQERSAEIFK